MILILNCGSQKTPNIERLVDEFMDFKTIPVLDFEITDLLDVKGVIISGAPLLITEMDMSIYVQKMEWLKEATIPVLGICFGHQIIGLTFGAYGSRMREDRDFQVIEIFEECALFDKLPVEIEMLEDHCETISIPPGFDLIGSSDVCVNEVMKHKSKPIFGVQFHPEVSGNHGRIVFQNFIDLCQ